MNRSGALLRALTLAAVTLLVLCSVAQAKDKWEVVDREDGVVVSQNWPKGYELPIIKGVGVVQANIYEILAVMADIDRMCEWLHSCKKARLVSQKDEFDRITYNRFDLPWPLDDRDAVLQSRITVETGKEYILIKYWDLKNSSIKPVEDVVRVPQMKGFYKLEKLGDEQTRVTYQGEARPGGLVPDWAVAQSARNIPLESIKKLRKQVKRMKGKYPDFVKTWDPRQGGMGF
jgi:hypothetical protein